MKLQIKNLYKSYQKKEVLKDVNIELNSGEVLAVVGRNGSGKTTLLQSIVGIINVNSGEILLDDINILKNNSLRNEIMYIPDRFDYFKFSKIKKVIEYYKIIYNNFDEEIFLLELKKNKISENKKFSQLSKGETMLVAILLGLSSNAKFLLFDEPLDGIDIININLILDYILDAQEKGVGIIISSHQLSHIEKISNKIYFLGDFQAESSTEEVNKEDYVKYQIVYENVEEQQLMNDKDVLVLNHIGRVYTVIVKDSATFEEKLLETKPVQYDKLIATIEEIFIFKNREEEK